jgi:hypothetical protein
MYSYPHVGVQTLTSAGDGSFRLGPLQETAYGWDGDDANRRWFVGDVDQDGKSDLYFAWSKAMTAMISYPHVTVNALQSQGGGMWALNYAASETSLPWDADDSTRRWFSGDVNGDGKKADIAYVERAASNDTFSYEHVRVSTLVVSGSLAWSAGSTQESAYTWERDPSKRQWFAGDFDGGGALGFGFLSEEGGRVKWSALQWNGAGWNTLDMPTAYAWEGRSSERLWFAGDSNGDGHTDLSFIWRQPAGYDLGYDHLSVVNLLP